MNGEEAVLLVIDGLARATKDADFVIQTGEPQRRAFLESLPSEFLIGDQVTFETVTGHRRPIIKVPAIPCVIERFDLSDDIYDQTRFSRRKRSEFSGLPLWLPAPEDVVVQKLRRASLAKRPQDLVDASNVLKVSGAWPYIEKWCVELGAADALTEARRLAGD